MVTAVPLAATSEVVFCTQYVFAPLKTWENNAWFAPTVRAVAALRSAPTPNTNEFAAVVVSTANGQLVVAVALAFAPTPAVWENAMTVSDTV